MRKTAFIMAFLFLGSLFVWGADPVFETDTIGTNRGELLITHIGHASLVFTFDQKIIHVDPCSRIADYAQQPKADLILLTHEHGDHFDPSALDAIAKETAMIILSRACFDKLKKGTIMANGDKKEVLGLVIEAVPAYNIVSVRENGQPFHPRGQGNGYVITFGEKRVYVAGDTELIPEMKDLKAIDIAFLPANLPYTMSADMVADAAKLIKPKIFFPYHFFSGKVDLARIEALLKDCKDIDLRIRHRAGAPQQQ